jgi:uncharacterized protein YjbJ (UPF0337 family)
MSKTQEKAEGFTRQVIGQMIGDDLLVQEGKELEQKANQEDTSENVTGQRQQPSRERSRQPPARKDESNG